jgi:hypothetical protein
VTTNVVIRLPGEELNRRLEEISLKIERVSLLIEDTMVDPAETIAMERSKYNDLILCLSKYGELLNSFQEMTEDAAGEIREMVGEIACGCDKRDGDEEIEAVEEDEDVCH